MCFKISSAVGCATILYPDASIPLYKHVQPREGLCNIEYPPGTLQLKSRDTYFAHNLFPTSPQRFME